MKPSKAHVTRIAKALFLDDYRKSREIGLARMTNDAKAEWKRLMRLDRNRQYGQAEFPTSINHWRHMVQIVLDKLR